MRIFTEGFEMGLVDTSVWSGGMELKTGAVVRPGSGVYSATFHSANVYRELGASFSEFYLRTAIRMDRINNNALIGWYNAGTVLGYIYFTAATRKITLYVGNSSLVATGTKILSLATWYLLEVYVKISDAGGVITLKIDGMQDCTFSGDTKPGADTNIDRIRFFNNYSSCYWDDIALNDTVSAVDNSWCGDGHVITLAPNANGDLSQLLGSDGDSTDNYLLVDETSQDGDTTYVEGSAVDEKDLYNLAASGLLTNSIIKEVWVEAVCKDTVGAGGLLALVLKTNSVEYASADIALGISYATLRGTNHPINPHTSATWTIGELDALQVGPKTRS